MTDKEAKDYILECDVAPDDIVVNGKWWKIETTYLSRREALDSAEFLDHYKLFKYKNGYVLYERNYDVPDESQAVKTSTFEARIYRGDELLDRRDIEAVDHIEAESKIRKALGDSRVYNYDVEIVTK